MPNINEELTFGLELEIVKLTDQAGEIINRRGFQRRYDRTIRGHNNEALPESIELGGGCEVITKPITVGVTAHQDGAFMSVDYRDAEEIVRDLCKCALEVNISCGLHVHLGRPVKNGEPNAFGVKPSKWEPEKVRTFLAVCTLLEEKFFNVCPESRRNNRYCAPIKNVYVEKDLTAFYPTGQVVPRKYDNPKRYCWLNLIETQRQGTDPRIGRGAGPGTGTIEVRMLGNVRRFNYIWAWVQLWLKFAAFVAYVPSSLALSHLVLGSGIQSELETLAKIKKEGSSKLVKKDAEGNVILSPDREDNANLEVPQEATSQEIPDMVASTND